MSKNTKGYALIHRDILDNSTFKNAQEAMAFALLILKATHVPVEIQFRGIAVNLEVGQLAITTRDFAESMGWTTSKVARFFNKLSVRGMIRASIRGGPQPKHRMTVLTVCNYSQYQTPKKAPEPCEVKIDACDDVCGDKENNTQINKNKYTREELELIFERKRKSHVKTALPDGTLELPDSFRTIAANQNHKSPDNEWLNFTEHSRKNGRKFICWKSAWSGWVRNSFKFAIPANNNFAGRKQSAGDAAVEGARLAMAEGHNENSILF